MSIFLLLIRFIFIYYIYLDINLKVDILLFDNKDFFVWHTFLDYQFLIQDTTIATNYCCLFVEYLDKNYGCNNSMLFYYKQNKSMKE